MNPFTALNHFQNGFKNTIEKQGGKAFIEVLVRAESTARVP